MEYKVITDLAFTYIGLVTTMTKHYVDQGVPLIFNSSIKITGIETSNPVFLDNEFAEKNKTRKHKKGDVLTVHTGDIGVSAVVPESLDGSLGFATIVSRITNSEIILPEYLCAFLNYGGGKEQLYKYSRDARNNLNLTDFNKLIVPVPEIEVQHSIIDRISRILKLIEKRNQELHLLDDLIKARFVEMFGDPVLNTLGWSMPLIEDIVSSEKNALKAGPFGSALKKEYYVESGYKIYGQEQVIAGDVNFGDYYIDEERYQSLENCAVKTGDVLISLVGTYGKLLIIPDEFEPGIINPRLMKITFDKKKVNPVYFKFYFQSDSLKKSLSENTHGGTMDILNLGIVRKIAMPLPPLDLQNQFVDFVNQVDKSKSVIQKSLEETQLLFDSLMQEYFG